MQIQGSKIFYSVVGISMRLIVVEFTIKFSYTYKNKTREFYDLVKLYDDSKIAKP